MEGYRVPGIWSPKALSPLLVAITPNPSVLLQYPMFFTMARVTCHSELLLKANGRRMSALQASFVHGIDVYERFGLFALYRGLPIYLAHSFATTVLAHPTKKIKSRRVAAAARLAVDASVYPLLLACTRMAAYTTGESRWSFTECIENTLAVDGVFGLWAGVAPFLLVSAYREFEDLIFENLVNKQIPNLDEADTAILGFVRVGLGAVLASPFLTMSTMLRCQSNNPSLMPPTSMGEVFMRMPWKWNLFAISIVLTLGGINLMLIREKHKHEEL